MTRSASDRLPALLRGDQQRLGACLTSPGWTYSLWCLGIIAVGAGCYGAAIGAWRSPLQAGYTTIKLPLILLLTTLGNALLNGLLAPLLGAALTFRQTVLAILSSFAIASVILGAFAPLVFFQVWSLPAAITIDNLPSSRSQSGPSVGAFSLIQLTHVSVIAFAGITANLRLLQLLTALTGTPTIARKVLWGWLMGNTLLGTQLSWIFRPFFGAPTLPVEFLRPHPMQGSFIETIWNALQSSL